MQEFFRLYEHCNWAKQILIFANVVDHFVQQFGVTPLKGWQHAEKATYLCPATIHRIYRGKQTVDSANLDNIIAFTVDVDYKNTAKKYFGEIYVDLLDAGIPPSMIVDTPHGYHCWYFLKEPLVMRWTETAEGWKLRKEAEQALSWYRCIANALIHRFISLGLPADRIANSPARLFRNPTTANIRHLDMGQKYSMHQLSDNLESWNLNRSVSVPAFRKILTTHFDGVREGCRNQIGCKVALALVSEYGAMGLQHFLSWADRCDPPYPHFEAEAVWRSVFKKWAKGEISFVRREAVRTRQEQGPYARKQYSAKLDERIAAAVVRMQAAGCADPWQHPRALAKEATIPLRTIMEKKKDIFSE